MDKPVNEMTEDELKAAARAMAKAWALKDLKAYLGWWSEDRNRLDGGAIDFTRQRQIIRDIMADIEAK